MALIMLNRSKIIALLFTLLFRETYSQDDIQIKQTMNKLQLTGKVRLTKGYNISTKTVTTDKIENTATASLKDKIIKGDSIMCQDGKVPVCFPSPNLSKMPGNPKKQECCWDCQKGMTMRVVHHKRCRYLDFVRCVKGECDEAKGDTYCYNILPILCMSSLNLPKPNLDGSTKLIKAFKWSKSYLSLTEPIQGCAIKSQDHADEICKDRFGDGWKMVKNENKDFYSFFGHGDLEATPWVVDYLKWEENKRFWVASEFDNANCWSKQGGN